jgi:hypothetical protein
MIAIPFNFSTAGTNNIPSGHSNMLIYRPDEKTIERFEPHGQKFKHGKDNQDEIINEVLKTMFEKKMKPYLKIYTPKYIPPNEICPSIKGFQALENEIAKLENEGGGYCNLWSVFFLELMFLNPKLSTKEVLQKALDITKEDPQYFKNIIRGYVKITEQVVDKFIKRIDETDGFSYEYEVKKITNIMSKKDKIMDELLKYYLSIGSKNTQFEIYEKKKEERRKLNELKKKYSNLYNYIAFKSIEDLLKVINKIYGKKPMYNEEERNLAIKYILQMVNYKPDTEKKIYKLI